MLPFTNERRSVIDWKRAFPKLLIRLIFLLLNRFSNEFRGEHLSRKSSFEGPLTPEMAF